MVIKIVKKIGEGTLQDAINIIQNKFNSEFGDFLAEGIVLRPKITLFSRKGDRIITKIKHRDKFQMVAKSEGEGNDD